MKKTCRKTKELIMCGISGIFVGQNKNSSRFKAEIERMTSTLEHRGPDSMATWIESDCSVFLGHARLAVLDLTDTGSQPMMSKSGRYVMCFNGEIYNYKELRQKLSQTINSFHPRGSSDSEIAVECFEAWGIEKALKLFNGMFALILWDRRERVLSIARDRFGEKPIYYGNQAGVWFITSELHSLYKSQLFDSRICHQSASYFVKHGYIPRDKSIISGVKKLPPPVIFR